jgi:hypothetical protein
MGQLTLEYLAQKVLQPQNLKGKVSFFQKERLK